MKKETKQKSMFRISINFIILLFFICAIGTTAFCASTAESFQKYENDTTQMMIDSPIEVDTVLLHESIKTELIAEVDEYISKRTKNKAHKSIAESIVNNALEHNIDICFMMSQTEIETNFGVYGMGRASSKRSLFGVTTKRKYKSYDEAISDYCRVLKKFYLTKGRTEKDLMKKFTTSKGKRYAGNPKYEKELTMTYKKISSKTEVNQLQILYKKFYNEYLASLNLINSNENRIS